MESSQSQDVTALAKAMLKVQAELQPAMKDAENPFTKSYYATLNSVMDACRDILISNGIWLCQYPVPTEAGHMGLVTKLTHAESGQWQASLAVVPLPKADPQGYGSCITYARRYGLTAMLGMITEDDDGAGAVFRGKRTVRKASSLPKNDLPDLKAPNTPPASVKHPSMPTIDGISYQSIRTQDGRECIVANGDTQAKKSLLIGAGFKWHGERKMWWKYADAS